LTKIRTSLNPFLVLHVYYVWHIGKNFIGNTPKDTTLQGCASCWSGAEELGPSNLSGVPTKIAQLERRARRRARSICSSGSHKKAGCRYFRYWIFTSRSIFCVISAQSATTGNYSNVSAPTFSLQIIASPPRPLYARKPGCKWLANTTR
jgi:hypothetical protein